MNQITESIRRHYETRESEVSVAKVEQVLNAPGSSLTVAQMSGLDQFHVRGLSATQELAQLANIGRETKILDAGSGLGGPSRFLADAYGCRVIGVDLTPSFVAISQYLNERAGLSDLVSSQVGDLLALPFANESFDAVWTQHVVMNVRDRERLYREFRRVLKPGGKLAFHDVFAADAKPETLFPVPWAETSETSFLLTQAETKVVLKQSGFSSRIWNDVTAETLAWFAELRPSPGTLSLATIMGPRIADLTANFARNVRQGRIQVVMGVCEATGVAER